MMRRRADVTDETVYVSVGFSGDKIMSEKRGTGIGNDQD